MHDANARLGCLQDLIRISVGTEHIDDIIADFEQSFKAAGAATTKEEEAPAEKTDAKAEEAPTVV